jgi:4-hydroxy-tetrahydrodipicolinate synthase
VVAEVVKAAAGRVPVIAGTGSNNTVEAIRLTQHAEAAGADAALVVTPYYNKPTQAGLLAHYRAVHDATNLPIIIYNIPGRSVIDMSPETMGELAKLPRIIGVKDATGDVTRVSKQRITCGKEFIQLSGEDASAIGYTALDYQDRLMPLHTAIFLEPGVAGAKYGLSKLGLCENEVRLPLVGVTDATKARIDDAMRHAGLIN